MSKSMNDGNGAQNWQGPQAGPQQDWETALARGSGTTFWELV
jgi:hypothetical protein